MQATDKLVNTIIEAVDERQNKKAKSYDTTATVTRIEGSTAYVHIPGGVDETPATMTISANKGDTVQVRVGGGRAWLVGNASNPPTDDTKANAAAVTAGIANQMAGEAVESANIAAEAADAAQDSARRAETSANEAKESALTANIAANGALTSLADVEDVIDVLEWIQQNGTYALTEDTSVVPGKYYFTKNGSTYIVVDDPTGDPSAQGYYECTGVTEAITDFVSAHLSLTNQGLFVLKDNNAWKVLIKNDGVEIRDPQNNAAANYGASTTVGLTASGHVVLTSNGLEVFNGSTSLANFGSTVRVGSTSNGNVTLNSSGVTVNKGSTDVAFFGDTARIGKNTGTNNNLQLTSDGLVLAKGSSSYAGHINYTSATSSQSTLNIGAGAHDVNYANVKCDFSPLDRKGEVVITGDYGNAATLEVIGRGSGLHSEIDATADGITMDATADGITMNGFALQGASGARWTIIPVVNGSGVMEVGKYIDFHTSNADTSDYNVRLAADGGSLYINGSLLSDFVIEKGTKTQSGITWSYRKWKSDKVEAWTSITFASATPSQWVANLYYKDYNTIIPSGIFSSVPSHITATTTGADNNLQWTVYSTQMYDSSGTYSVTLRFTRPNSTAGKIKASIFVYS